MALTVVPARIASFLWLLLSIHCRFRVSRLVMFGTVLQKHFCFKFRLRDLRDCLWYL